MRSFRGSWLISVACMLLVALASSACGGASKKAGTSVTPPSSAAPQRPAWAASLGPDVSVTAPGSSPPPGLTSPGAVVEAEARDFSSGRLVEACSVLEPAVQTKCGSALAGQPATGASISHLSLGYIATKGNQALVGTTGTDCEASAKPTCVTNKDPAAIFASGQTFDAQYDAAVVAAGSPVHAYSLIPCVRVGSRWYVYLPAGDL
jgi:hypothetical protein